MQARGEAMRRKFRTGRPPRPQPGFWRASPRRPARQQKHRGRGDWLKSAGSLSGLVVGLVAVIGLIFTAQTTQQGKSQTQASQQQVQINQQGQLIDRYNAAIANLGSPDIDIRLVGIYGLQRLAQDSPRDQPTVVAVLCAFARGDRVAAPGGAAPETQPPPAARVSTVSSARLPIDVQVALTVIGSRDPRNDGPAAVIDLDHAALPGARLGSARLGGADLSGADLHNAYLNDTDLTLADLSLADLAGTSLTNTRLAGADLAGADLSGTRPTDADLAGANLSHVNLSSAILAGDNLDRATLAAANLTHAVLAGEALRGVSFATADLTGAVLSGADLSHGYLVAARLLLASMLDTQLTGADLTGADLTGADVRDSRFTDANLSYANLTGAHVSGAIFTGADLTGVNWPAGTQVPQGWRLNPGTGLLERTGG